eukprot:3512934-Amphidinium_carterae.1
MLVHGSGEQTTVYRAMAARAVTFQRIELTLPLWQMLVAGARQNRPTSHQCTRGIGQATWQEMPQELKVHCDSDHACNVAKRTSTSGWCALNDKHLIAGGTSSQNIVALSSGESEDTMDALRHQQKAEGLGLSAVAAELGDRGRGLVIETDSSASYAICRRHGHGRTKHLDIKFLWVQHVIAQKCLRIVNILRTENSGDFYCLKVLHQGL